MDCFYAAVHVRDDPSLAGKPVVIGGSPEGRGVVAAASYEARAFGVRSAMPAARAVRLCPQAIFLPPEFSRYRSESEEIFAIYRELTPLVQSVSIDEAYLDVTDHLAGWQSATAIAREIRRRVRAERRLTVSIGVAPNRLVAKIASDQDKPDGLTVVRPHQVEDFLAPLPVRRLHGVGPATERALAALGVRIIADLRSVALPALLDRFGRHGQGLWEHARGIDDRPVRTSRERKSLGKETTFARDLASLRDMEAVIERISAAVAASLGRREIAGHTVTVKVRFADFTTITRSATRLLPVASAAELAEMARELLRSTDAVRRPVRLLGVTVSKLVARDAGQLVLF